MTPRAVPPATTPPPMDPPILGKAKRIPGAVLTPPPSSSSSAPRLERRSSVTGNILLIDQTPYLLQRKLEATLYGSRRVAYRLETTQTEDGLWQVVEPYAMVTVAIEDKASVLSSPNELSALQLIARHTVNGHVQECLVAAEDERFVYTVTEYHPDGTLAEYCAAHDNGRLTEPGARFFLQQILQGLQTLQTVGLCHRNLSLENVHLASNQVTLVGLTHALRIPKSGAQTLLIEAQPPCGTYPQYLAPELFAGQPFDGAAVDLWAVGIMLYAMLLGSDSLFAAPIVEDRRFVELCVESRADWDVSESARDLLLALFKADPRHRLTLDQVFEHAWVLDATVTPPKCSVASIAAP